MKAYARITGSSLLQSNRLREISEIARSIVVEEYGMQWGGIRSDYFIDTSSFKNGSFIFVWNSLQRIRFISLPPYLDILNSELEARLREACIELTIEKF